MANGELFTTSKVLRELIPKVTLINRRMSRLFHNPPEPKVARKEHLLDSKKPSPAGRDASQASTITQDPKFNPADCGGVETCIVVSYFKDGQHDLAALARMLKNKAAASCPTEFSNAFDWYRSNPKSFKSQMNKHRREAKDNGWWDLIPQDYWKSYKS